MSPRRVLPVALLVVLAGCAGVGPGDTGTTDLPTATTEETTDDSTTVDDSTTAGPTTDQTTEPHTGVGTSHISDHLSVRAGFDVQNVSVTLAPDGDAESHPVDTGSERDFTRDVHERGHDVRVVVTRGNETVFDQMVRGYEYYQITVYENETTVDYTVV